jgi:hypothetical protein
MMSDLVERIRQVIEQHGETDHDAAVGTAWRCGGARRSDHWRHLAEEIVDRLGLRPETVGREIRYVSAWFDDELTKLEGAE